MDQKEKRLEKKIMRTIEPQKMYRHFKGNLYFVLDIAEHTETGEMMVVYKALYGEYKTTDTVTSVITSISAFTTIIS